ncbi:hypothetical protein ACFFRR_002116 [Megaselia abdita]
MWSFLSSCNLFFKLEFSEDGNDVCYHLTNVKNMWKENLSLSEAFKRVKTLNRLIKFNDDTIKETILRNDPEFVEFKDNELILKYKVDGDPFKFTWKLVQLSADEFLEHFTNPLMFCVEVLAKENEKLKAVIEQKDIEIEQFKIEGNVLRRTTVATLPFDMKAYDERNSKLNSITKDFHEIANTMDFVQKKLKEFEATKSPEAKSPKKSPSTKSKKRSLKTQLYNERLKRLKQDKNKAQYEESEDSEEILKNGT